MHSPTHLYKTVWLLQLGSLYASFCGYSMCMMCWWVPKATPIQFINGNKLKSCRMGLTNHTQPISHHITPLVINALEGKHTNTDTDTDAQTKTISRNQSCTWLKKHACNSRGAGVTFVTHAWITSNQHVCSYFTHVCVFFHTCMHFPQSILTKQM